LIDCARENHIILLCLPPHTTHARQPLDVSVFKSLKSHFSKALRAWCFTKKNFVVTKRDFARVVKEPYESALSMANIKSGFAKCGVFPLNRRAIPQLKLLPSEFHPCNPGRSNACGTTSANPDETDDESSNELIGESMPEVSVPSSVGDLNTGNPSNDIQDQSMSITLPSTSTPISSPETGCSETHRLETIPLETPRSVTPRSSNVNPSPLCNPLVMAGLVPQNLADILSTSGCEDEQKPKRRVFKARVLTEQEFYQTLKDKEEKWKRRKSREE